ncbi:sigma-70 family RNA polymerase sigma factor [Lacticigenium naphthae]|uniref:sigma-70 family RNA polymerase sigma factor n=1 Tax=Lacticigenium naphthae TaxID=515351 RepID=UPI0003FC409E|nr:FliA/WhiG family RNA polymerase sigma factor [Lacticigenium naphthae]
MDETKATIDMLEYMPLVEKAARNTKVKSHLYDQDDLISMGTLGLMDAIEKYKPDTNVPFEKYAYVRIKGSIIDEVRKHARVPRTRVSKLNEFYRAKEELERKHLQTPSELEICQAMGIDKKQLSAIHQTIHSLAAISLEDILFKDSDNDREWKDSVEDKKSISVEGALLQSEQSDYLKKAIGSLTEREQTILQLYYVDSLPLKEIAYIYNLSVPRISQIHAQLLLKLRSFLRREYHD